MLMYIQKNKAAAILIVEGISIQPLKSAVKKSAPTFMQQQFRHIHLSRNT
ncbi:protein of unknown function [Paenibacillus alvei]|uniref:Uncharacterized protein n=1 Tax=Paenibacillus alvei TaxID=44250 RepID=A0A383R630_PAEAL|nr:protein of unknown function [Paenibacillus alvei]